MIPFVPLPVFFHPHWDALHEDALSWPDLRASHADRDTAADILCAAVADGRLTLDELDERLEHVLSARTLREIARLICDLPGHRFPGPAQATGPAAPPADTAAPPRTPADPRSPAPGAQRRPRPRPAAESRWSLLQSLTAPAGCP